MFEDDYFPKRQSIKGDGRIWGKKHIKKFFGRQKRKSTRFKVRNIRGKL